MELFILVLKSFFMGWGVGSFIGEVLFPNNFWGGAGVSLLVLSVLLFN